MAGFAASAQLRDMTAGHTLRFRELQNVSVTGIEQLILVGVPGAEGVEKTERETFEAKVLRGHVIRFTAFAAVRAESGLSRADSIFTSGQFESLDGHFGIRNLDVEVFPDEAGGDDGPTPPELAELLAQLAERLNNLELELSDRLTDLNTILAEQLDELRGVDEGLQAQIDALQGEVGDLQAQIDGLETTVGDVQAQLADLQARATELEADVAAHGARLMGVEDRTAALEALVSAQGDQITALQELATMQQQQIADLRNDLETHTHEYQAPRGKGSNRVTETTGPAEFPVDDE
jgi:uncharacterized coiled-coil protein SlyX